MTFALVFIQETAVCVSKALFFARSKKGAF